MALSGEFVKVVIECDGVFEDSLDGKVYRIEPGVETMIPVEAARLWFGWPTILSDNPIYREREERRLKARRGGAVPKLLRAEKHDFSAVPEKAGEKKGEEEKAVVQEEEFPELKNLRQKR